jgi:hypothetical protein
MKTLLLIPVILYTWLSLTHRDKIYHQIPNPTNKQKYIYQTPTRPTDNPINPIRDLNPKNTNLLPHQTKQISK